MKNIMAKEVLLNPGTKYMNRLQFVSFFADCKEHVCFSIVFNLPLRK